MAHELHAKSQAYNRAAANAAATARSADGEGAAALARTSAALSAAAQHCGRAAQALTAASSEGQAFVQRTVGGNGGAGGTPSADQAASEAPTAQQVPSLSEIEGWLGEINPGYTGDPYDPRSVNCGNCARAVYDRLQGGPSGPAGLGTLSISEMEAATGKRQVPMSPADIEAALIAAGPGSHAVIGIDRKGSSGHWFNAYYDGNRVVAIDGQSGTISGWPPEYGSPRYPVTNWDAGL
ncbi:MAG: toxin glutamine deamidase domain-containing protein [Dehalococcoidia bacterium]